MTGSKRLLDVTVSLVALVCMAPILLPILIAVSAQDSKSPFYAPKRGARGGGSFTLYKVRSMVLGADKSGVNSTSAGDARITPIGRFVRRWKLDELPQFWNVLKGDMSIVGPRPQVQADIDRYTEDEARLLTVRPGITDFSSIVFSDEGAIIAGFEDPDLAYNQLIRPWKSRLGLFYIERSSVALDIRLIWLTALAIVSKRRALDGITTILTGLGAPEDMIAVCRRQGPLSPAPPPGMIAPVDSL